MYCNSCYIETGGYAMKYHPEEFASLLNHLIGKQQKKEFAAQIGITPYTLSRYLHQKIQSPPPVALLQKIKEARPSASYSSLLASGGYLEREDAALLPEPVHTQPEKKKYMEATILSALHSLSLPWTTRPETEGFDLAVTFPEQEGLCWYFQFLSGTCDDQARQLRLSLYYHLLFHTFRSTDKYSFVTGSEEEFSLYQAQRPVNLHLPLSILLIDEKALQVKKESWLTDPEDFTFSPLTLVTEP